MTSNQTFECLYKKIRKFDRDGLLSTIAELDTSYCSRVLHSKIPEEKNYLLMKQGYLLKLAHIALTLPNYRKTAIATQHDIEDLITDAISLGDHLSELLKMGQQYVDIVEKAFSIKISDNERRSQVAGMLKSRLLRAIRIQLQYDHVLRHDLNGILYHAQMVQRLVKQLPESSEYSYQQLAHDLLLVLTHVLNMSYVDFKNFIATMPDAFPLLYKEFLMSQDDLHGIRHQLENTLSHLRLYLPNKLFLKPIVEIALTTQTKRPISFRSAFQKACELKLNQIYLDINKKGIDIGKTLTEPYLSELLTQYLKDKVEIRECASVEGEEIADYEVIKNERAIIFESKASISNIQDMRLLEPKSLFAVDDKGAGTKLFGRLKKALDQCIRTAQRLGQKECVAIICINQDLFLEGELFRHVIHYLKNEINTSPLLAVEIISALELEACLVEFSFDEIFKYAQARWIDQEEAQDDSLLLYIQGKAKKIQKNHKTPGIHNDICWPFQLPSLKAIAPELGSDL